MPTHKVRELADQLAEELHRGAIDDDSRAALEALRGEVDHALEGGEVEEAPSEKARTLTERFERDHPELTALIQRLSDALVAIGL